MQSLRMSEQKAKAQMMKQKSERNQEQVMSASWFGCLQTHVMRLLIFAVLASVAAMSIDGSAQIVSPEVMKISERFVCQCGCSEQLSVCAMLNCGSATPLRAEIAELLKQGKTEKEITSIFVAKYGKVILAAPTTQGFDLTAWTLPFVMFVLGLALIYYLIRLWARPRAVPAVESGSMAEVPQDYQQRIESELKNLDL
ncbi:MAG TPA: cytochrome c-type biogenesis protein CcmH [Terriglobia bacterium]|nr:cytochrome c-type biogenesis protein CcmH [Terriglobia bacterium]